MGGWLPQLTWRRRLWQFANFDSRAIPLFARLDQDLPVKSCDACQLSAGPSDLHVTRDFA